MIQYILYLVILIIFAFPLGNYISKVMIGQKTCLSFLYPIEKLMYKVLNIDPNEQMNWKVYLLSVLLFSGGSFLLLFLMMLCQQFLPANPQQLEGIKWDLAFNTAISFMTNTNWQAYSGESMISYFTQAIGLTVQNFVSAATGIAVLFAFIRGFMKVESNGLGNYFSDMIRSILYILLPINLILSLLLVAGGVIQNGKHSTTVFLLEPIILDDNLEILDEAILVDEVVMIDDKVIENAIVIREQFIPMGASASQIAIKQTGTNGGGYFGTNSAHPFENPNAFTNLIELISILLIPVALCFTFGHAIGNKKQGVILFVSMFLCLCIGLIGIAISEQSAPTHLLKSEMIDSSTINQAGGNMEGKESRFGIVSSVTWTTFTTAASNGSVNSMLDSYTPIGGMIAMLFIQLGEVIFGGVGSGLYGMLGFVILSVFIAGLMVGRTPEFLNKKIEPYEMKYSILICLATPIAILVGSGIAAMVPSMLDSLTNSGSHGFSEMLYAYTSAGGNNGSAFAGLNANTVFLNVSLGFVMLFARFIPIVGVLAVAGNLVSKKKIALTSGSLSTTNMMFVFLLIFVVILIGALSFFCALSLGPIAEFFESIL